MPVVKYRDVISSALSRPVFTLSYLTKRGVPEKYAKVLIHRLVKRGVVHRVERGLYATVDDPIVVGGNMVFPSYISMYTALSLRGVLYQVPSTVQIVTTRRRKNKRVDFFGSVIEFYRIKREFFFGFEYIYFNGFEVPVASVEKAIIDIFYFKGGVIGTIDVEVVDVDRLVKYLEIMNKKSLKRKVLRWISDVSSFE